MLRQVLAALGSTFALVAAVAAVAIVGTAAVVFDRWPAPGDAAPSARAPLAGAAQPGTATRPAALSGAPAAATATDRDEPDIATGRDGEPGAPPEDGIGAAGGGTTPRSLPVRRRTGGSPVRDTGGQRPATGPTTTDGAATDQLAETVETTGGTAVENARGGGTAAGEAVGEMHAPAGASATSSADAAATSVQQAADVVADVLRRLPAA